VLGFNMVRVISPGVVCVRTTRHSIHKIENDLMYVNFTCSFTVYYSTYNVEQNCTYKNSKNF